MPTFFKINIIFDCLYNCKAHPLFFDDDLSLISLFNFWFAAFNAELHLLKLFIISLYMIFVDSEKESAMIDAIF